MTIKKKSKSERKIRYNSFEYPFFWGRNKKVHIRNYAFQKISFIMMNHKCKRFVLTFLLVISISVSLFAQNKYRYEADLISIQNDQVAITLYTPTVKVDTALLCFPKIIPGTYKIADYGRFITAVKAFTKKGDTLPVTKLNANQWKIDQAKQLYKITYAVDDIFDASGGHGIYPMAATNIEAGNNIIINTPGFFGFLNGFARLPFEVTFHKPDSFYASTSLKPVKTEKTKDVFSVPHVDDLYDAPIMYAVPDTANIKVANTQVLVSVISPNKKVTAREIAGWMDSLLQATGKYFGGKLPVDKYAFLYYFKDPAARHSFGPGGGALEHNTSSFYYLSESPNSLNKNNVVDISSHEFFHIVTPLNVASREVKIFNWNEPVMSKHLWMYEGITEYTSHHVLVRDGMNTVMEFLGKMAGKITTSQTYFNDTLPFVDLSKQSVGKHGNQFSNVYQKGALIGMALDLELLKWSNGKYGVRELMKDLGKRFGKDKYFEDEEIFDIITSMTFPGIRQFFQKYVEGNTPIPYVDYFAMAGVQLVPETSRKAVTSGGISFVAGAGNKVMIGQNSKFDELGILMGYQKGDEIIHFNGTDITTANAGRVINQVLSTIKEGDDFIVRVVRKNNDKTDTLTLQQKFIKGTVIDKNKVSLITDSNEQQLKLREAWLGRKE